MLSTSSAFFAFLIEKGYTSVTFLVIEDVTIFRSPISGTWIPKLKTQLLV